MITHGSYKIESIEHIGDGSFGDVEKVKLTNINDSLCGYYARKILSNQHQDPSLLARFRREVKAQDRCLHKYVAQIFIASLDTTPAWFVMELAEKSLQDEIDDKSLTKADKIKAILMLSHGVNWIHSKGYLHRDIKPQNILKFKDGSYKISDFGIARHMDPAEASKILTQVGHFPRTPKYFDHNVVLNGYSNQSDIFSIGIIIEELNIDGFDDIVSKCTDRRLQKRYLNTSQLIADIVKIGGI
ncbi:protein kinase domain-containing protein [Pantoea sp. JKS000250]|uniref:protein kinase domain-containing protein n=1 Tax=Pantoea sp. JKS000250 TaxID=1938795 RepID=UPI000D763BF8|nr:protein kinase [Pantoea sp. JKS000250]PXW18623.1 serine/threonine-protein kinase [Pantoea sp. JKS000250]